MYKKGMSKTKYKESLRMFWTKDWVYEKSIEEWKNGLTKGFFTERSRQFVSLTTAKNRYKYIIIRAIDKLVLEKKLTKDAGKNISEMINSPDEESVYTALSILQTLKPKKFKKV